jgi:putative glutamine amidotransferase
MSKQPKRRMSWLKRIGALVVVIVAVYMGVRLGFEFWRWAGVPADAPRIAISMDDTWLNTLGITRSTYDQAMARAGGRLVTLVPPVEGPATAHEVGALLDRLRIQGILLSGGGDVDPVLYGGDPGTGILVNRVRDDFEIALIHEAAARGIPILGICRGCQILNVAFNGTLTNLRDDSELKGRHFSVSGHPVDVAEDSVLAGILGAPHIDHVHSFHGQAVADAGKGVRTVATGPGDIVEAIECGDTSEGAWVIGIQWHPEMALTDDTQNALFDALVKAAEEHNPK